MCWDYSKGHLRNTTTRRAVPHDQWRRGHPSQLRNVACECLTQKLSLIAYNLAHETKTKNASAQLVQYRLKIREGRPEGIRRLWRKGFVKKMSSGVQN